VQKLSVLLIAILGMALIVPIFADEISDAITGTNGTNETNDTLGNNTTLTNNTTVTNSTLTAQQLQTLTDTQNKLTALIATIEGLKTTYGNNSKAKGLLNALDQYEKQANRLNAEISAFIQNPTANGTESIDGRINSFVKREAALEHKVAIKQGLLAKMAVKKAKVTKKVKVKNQKKNNN
jgi:hypothetical protein